MAQQNLLKLPDDFALPKDANLHAREYQLYLASKELLKAKLIEWAREEEVKP